MTWAPSAAAPVRHAHATWASRLAAVGAAATLLASGIGVTAQTPPPDPQGSGTYAWAVAPLRSEPVVQWELRTRYRDSSDLVAADGVLVTGNTSGQGGTFAYDLASGKLLWSVPGHIRGGPAVSGGFAFAVNDTRERYQFALRKLDLRTGKAAWSAAEEDLGNHDGPPVVVGDTVVVTSRNRVIGGYDVASGARRWQHTDVQVCDGRLSAADGVVFLSGGLAGTAHTLTALDAATGATRWGVALTTTDGKGCGTGTAVAGGLVVTGLGRDVVAHDAATGERRWGLMAARTVEGRREDLALARMVVTGGVAYVASRTVVVGVDVATGRQVFSLPLPGTADLASIAMRAADGVLYLHAKSSDGPPETRGAARIHAIDLAEGRVLWSHHAARPDRFDPAGTWSTKFLLPVAGGLVYENSQLLVRLR